MAIQSVLQPIIQPIIRPVIGFGLIRAPSTLTAAIDDTSGGIELTASEVSGADSYSYYYAIDGGAWQSAATGQGTSYTFTPSEAGEYSFGVTAVKGSTESARTTLVPDSLFDDVPNSEGIALMAFYEATNGDAWTTDTNWLTATMVGNWYGVTVSGGNVSKLSLVNNNLNGDITNFQESLFGLGLTLELWDNANLTFSSNFIMKIQTDKSGGTTNDDQISFDLEGVFDIAWGDGAVETINQSTQGIITHTYPSAGVYYILFGTGLKYLENYAFQDSSKQIEIRNWGDISWAINGYVKVFRQAENLDMTASDLPDFSNSPDLQSLFAYCESFVGNKTIEQWDLSGRTDSDYASMFRGTQFDQDLSSWTLNSNIDRLESIFANSSISTENYSRTLIGWANQVSANGGPTGVDMSGQTGCTYNNTVYGGTPYDNAVDARNYLTTATGSGGAGWTITGDSQV